MTSALIALLLMLSQQPSPQKGDVEGIAARPDTGAAITNFKISLRAGRQMSAILDQFGEGRSM
jgi:hypothetical protein